MAHEKILDKLRKLKALADRSTNQHEAELALARLNDIARQHGLSMADVEFSELGDVRQEQYVVQGQRMKLKWIDLLALGCAEMFDGMLVINSRLHGTSFTFVGFDEDIGAMKYIFEYLYRSWHSIVEIDLEKAKQSYYRAFTPRDTMKFKAGHGLAYAMAIRKRIKELVEARKADISRASSNGNALVIYKSAQVEDYLKGHKRVTTKASGGSKIGQHYGNQAGSSIPLGGGVGNASAPLMIGKS